MILPFLNRSSERKRISAAMNASAPALIVLYGRRRCGKSRLLREILSQDSVYYLADTQENPLQISAVASCIARSIPLFDTVVYPSWDVLLRQFFAQCRKGMSLVLDEFPYLVKLYPPLPGILQKLVDEGLAATIILCGSSQRMMQGLVLDSTAPLYGRAQEIIKIDPLMPGWITDGLALSGKAAFESYAIWGGVPRYWEAAREYPTLESAVKMLVLDKNGVFHDEPGRLLVDDIRSTSQSMSILTLVGNGCHRLSEIAARLGKPAVNLSKPLAQLIELGYITRELPFGEDVRSSKKTHYRISDPFLRFWFRFINPNRSLLELGLIDQVYESIMKTWSAYIGGIWEDCARVSTAFLAIDGTPWKPASRWWGAGLDRKPCEMDIVAESYDGKHILLGEAKWEDKAECAAEYTRLRLKASTLPFVKGRELHFALWAKNPATTPMPGCTILGPDAILNALRR